MQPQVIYESKRLDLVLHSFMGGHEVTSRKTDQPNAVKNKTYSIFQFCEHQYSISAPL